MEQVVSKKKNYNHSIQHCREYGIGIETEYDMLSLLNKLEAHGETLEQIGEYNSYAYEMYGKNTREDAVRFVLETNAFFQSWNKVLEFSILEEAETIEDAREQILWDIEYADYVLTTDGIVERNIV